MGLFFIWLLFVFMCVILSSRIGLIARYTPSLTYDLTLPKIQNQHERINRIHLKC